MKIFKIFQEKPKKEIPTFKVGCNFIELAHHLEHIDSDEERCDLMSKWVEHHDLIELLGAVRSLIKTKTPVSPFFSTLILEEILEDVIIMKNND